MADRERKVLARNCGESDKGHEHSEHDPGPRDRSGYLRRAKGDGQSHHREHREETGGRYEAYEDALQRARRGAGKVLFLRTDVPPTIP